MPGHRRLMFATPYFAAFPHFAAFPRGACVALLYRPLAYLIKGGVQADDFRPADRIPQITFDQDGLAHYRWE
jgi:hypothetical protein